MSMLLIEVPQGFAEALRRLVETGFVRRSLNPEDYRILTRSRAEASQVLADALGCRLHIGPDHYALQVHPAASDPALAPDWLSGGRASLGVAMFFYILWYAEHVGAERSALSDVAQAIRAEAAETGVAIDWTRRSDRRVLQLAMEHLRDLGFAVFREGSAQEWYEETGARDLLIEWRPAAWQSVLSLTPAVSDQVLSTEALLPAPEAFLERPTLRQRLLRWLLFHPILLASEDPEAFSVLRAAGEEELIREELRRYFACELELGEHFARARRRMTEDAEERPWPMNLQGDEARVGVLLCTELRRRLDAGHPELGVVDGGLIVSEDYLRGVVAALHEQYADCWKSEFKTASANLILRKVLPRMIRMGLARLRPAEGDGAPYIFITPAAAPLKAHYIEETPA